MLKPISGGFFDNDGNPINPFDVPKPGLCLLCLRDDYDDPEEIMLCAMNRWEQRNDDDFECGAWEKK